MVLSPQRRAADSVTIRPRMRSVNRLTFRLRISYKIIQAEQGGHYTLPAPGIASDLYAPGHAWVHFMTTALAAHSINEIGTELITTVVSRWIDLDQNLSAWEEADTGVCTDRVRQLGEQINRLGGHSALVAVCAEVGERLHTVSPDLELVFNTEINWVWNGIGMWQA